MSRLKRRLAVALAIAAVLLLSIAVTGVLVLRSDWLRERVRVAIIEQAELATGGRVEIGSFRFDWASLTAEVDGFVLHGTEAPGQAPLIAADRVLVGLRVISLISSDVRLERITVTHPRVHLIVSSEGSVNLPRPKVPGSTTTSDAILNLKIARFEVQNGETLVESPGSPPRLHPWSGTGRNLAALVSYNRQRDIYAGDVSLAPVHLALEGYGPLDVNVEASATMERNRIVVSKASVRSAASELDFHNMTIGPFGTPTILADYSVRASVAEAAKVLHWKMPISGPLNVAGKVRYVSPEDFDVAGDIRGNGLAYGSVRNIRLTGKVAGNQSQMALTGLRAAVLGGEAWGSIETKGYDVFRINGAVKNLDVRKIAALATPRSVPYDGLVAGPVTATGTLRDLSDLRDATAQLTIGPVENQPPVHGAISAHYTGSQIELGQSWLQLPNTRVDTSGTLGATLAVKLESKDLSDLLPALNGGTLPFTLKDGSASFDGSVTGPLANPEINGHAALRNALYSGRLVDTASADVAITGNRAALSKLSANYSGVNVTGAATIGLTAWAIDNTAAITANLATNAVDLPHALELAGAKSVEATGAVSATAQISGTIGNPVAEGDVLFRRGTIYQQPYDSISTHVRYLNAGLQTASGTFVSGPKRVDFQIDYPHAGLDFPFGTVRISATSNIMPLNQIAIVRARQPDIEGAAQFKGTASLRITRDAKSAPRVELAGLDGDASAAGIVAGGRNLGDTHLVARTQGAILTASFDSNAAKAEIHGQARVQLTGDNQTTGSVTFSNAGLAAITAVIVKQAEAKDISFDGAAQGTLTFNGALFSPKEMSASVVIPQIEVHPLPGTPLARNMPGFSVRNLGAIRVSFAKSVIHVDAARFQAPETDMNISGTADFSNSAPLNLRLQGDVNLAILRNFVPDLASSGAVAVSGQLRGTWSAPDFSGLGNIRGGEFHYADFTNGLTNAAGDIVFSGSRATIRAFNAETGGGKLSATGFVTLDSSGNAAFQFTAKTRDVRVRYPQGVSSISDSDIQIVRTPQRSSIAGTISVRRLVFNPEEDAAATLADMGHSSRAPIAGDNSFANMNLDVQIQTAPDVALQSRVAESIQADASLRLRGTVASPALLGRINVSQGSVLFFGNKYTISRGVISFFNPTRIEPILDVDLQTKARGVEVTLTVTGPPSKLGMTYRSDPPLEFSDIVALLATGRTPDDPSVALRGTGPTPSFEQLGASALIGQTIANPVAGRLQRFFGVSRIKIDPQLSGVSGNPGARLTVEQQVTPDILFTYITDVSNTSQQLIRVEWAFNRAWSAVLEREENGYVGLDFTYKKRFK